MQMETLDIPVRLLTCISTKENKKSFSILKFYKKHVNKTNISFCDNSNRLRYIKDNLIILLTDNSIKIIDFIKNEKLLVLEEVSKLYFMRDHCINNIYYSFMEGKESKYKILIYDIVNNKLLIHDIFNDNVKLDEFPLFLFGGNMFILYNDKIGRFDLESRQITNLL